MAILITEETKVVVQGMTGRIGQFHTQEMIATAPMSWAASPRARAAPAC
jgi:succinyl-CoA synthetase alpha subunit